MNKFYFVAKSPKILFVTKDQGSLSEVDFVTEQDKTVEVVSNLETACNILHREAFEYSAVVFDARDDSMIFQLREVIAAIRNRFSSVYPLIVVVTSEQHRRFFLDLNLDRVVSKIDFVQGVLKESQELYQIPQNCYLDLLAKVIRYRDSQLFHHMTNVRKYTLILAELCTEEGLLSKDILERISLAAFFHDIGKILIADEITRKTGKLTDEEFEQIKKHTVLGAEMLQDIAKSNFAGKAILTMYEVIKYHHERWDGRGYPLNLTADQIPVSARIVAIADVFDALTCDRYYRPAYSVDEAIRIMKNDDGHFDPLIFSVFLKNIDLFK